MFILTISGFTQKNYSGRFVDQYTKKPVPYVTIKIKNTRFGSVANSDGKFYFSFTPAIKEDTTIFSCVGYYSKEARLNVLLSAPVIELLPITYNLPEVIVKEKKVSDFPYKLFYSICQKYRNFIIPEQAKAYFSFIGQENASPIEIIEGYFTGTVSPCNGIKGLKLKNARIGLGLNSFYSLKTTDIYTNFSPFSLSGNIHMPASASNFSYNRLKHLYNISIIRYAKEDGMKKFILQFIPRKDSGEMYAGLAYINGLDSTFEKLEYSLDPKEFYYLHPLITGDKVDSIRITLNFIFDNSNKWKPKITQSSLDYSLTYYSYVSARSSNITCQSNIIFYDFDHPFLPGIPEGLIESQDNDYQKIACIPHDSLFWEYAQITPRSNKQKDFISFFQTHGVLLNFSRQIDLLVQSNYIPWSGNSYVTMSDILNEQRDKFMVVSDGVKTVFSRPGNGFDINCKIFINPVELDDSIHLSSCTLLNTRDSYYFLDSSFKAEVFINLTFDLFEMKRREIISGYNQISKNHKLTISEISNIYSSAISKLDDTLKLFQKETSDGTDMESLLKWSDFISHKTGAHRDLLIQEMIFEEKNKHRKHVSDAFKMKSIKKIVIPNNSSEL